MGCRDSDSRAIKDAKNIGTALECAKLGKALSAGLRNKPGAEVRTKSPRSNLQQASHAKPRQLRADAAATNIGKRLTDTLVNTRVHERRHGAIKVQELQVAHMPVQLDIGSSMRPPTVLSSPHGPND